MFSFWGEIACDLQLEDVFEATSGAPVFCPVGLCLQTAVHHSSLTGAEEGESRVAVLMYLSIMFTFLVPPRHHGLVLSLWVAHVPAHPEPKCHSAAPPQLMCSCLHLILPVVGLTLSFTLLEHFSHLPRQIWTYLCHTAALLEGWCVIAMHLGPALL